MEEEIKEETPKKQKTKSEILMEKINALAEKIENEQNPIKRMLYSIRAKMVVAKLDREIEIQNLEEAFETKKHARDRIARGDKEDTRSEIIEINQRINELQGMLRRNTDYDYKRDSFIFGRDEVVRNGGIKNYIDILKASGRREQVEAAKKIEEAYHIRSELENLQDELAEKQDLLEDIDKEQKQEDRKDDITKNALVIKKRMNIFSRISEFFKDVKESVKETFAEYKKLRQTKTKSKEIKKENAEVLRNLKADIKAEYEQKMKELMEEYATVQEKIDAKRDSKENATMM